MSPIFSQGKSKFSMSRSGKRNKPQSKLVCQNQVTEQSVEKIIVSKAGQRNNPQYNFGLHGPLVISDVGSGAMKE
jgi:hypothetical protein